MPRVTIDVPLEVRQFPLRLELAMRAAGVNQVELARASGVGQSAISRMLSGRETGGALAHIVLIARALGVRVGWLAVGEEPMREAGQRGPAVVNADAPPQFAHHVPVVAKNK